MALAVKVALNPNTTNQPSLRQIICGSYVFDREENILGKGENDRPFENTVGKGEIARNEQFLLYPQCFLLV